MKLNKYIAAGLVGIMSLTSCGDDFMDTKYTANLDQESAGVAAAKNPSVFLNGLWSWMVAYQSSHDTFGFMSVVHATDMMSEDIAMGGFHWFGYDYDFDNREYNYRRTSSNWSTFYTMIAKSNEIISLYPEATSNDVKALLGQALAIRGFSYYYLIQLYQFPTAANGGLDRNAPAVPLMLTEADGKTAEELDALKGRNNIGVIADQIESDLNRAASLLEESGYKRAAGDKNNIDANVAYGILARYYLLAEKWAEAEAAAKRARQGYTFAQANVLDGFVTVANPEWMWGFNHDTETQTTFASFFSHVSNLAPGYNGLGYSSNLIDARLYSKIPADDVRKKQFNGPAGNPNASTAGAKLPYANIKFGHVSDWSEDYMYMRAPEMVLIEAEALVRQGKAKEAATTLAVLMDARQPSWSAIHESVDLEEVLLQRRIELWGEGFGYFDLKRLNRGIDRKYEGTNHLAGYIHQIPARDVKWIYQIPQAEIQENDHIQENEQNP